MTASWTFEQEAHGDRQRSYKGIGIADRLCMYAYMEAFMATSPDEGTKTHAHVYGSIYRSPPQWEAKTYVYAYGGNVHSPNKRLTAT